MRLPEVWYYVDPAPEVHLLLVKDGAPVSTIRAIMFDRSGGFQLSAPWTSRSTGVQFGHAGYMPRGDVE